MWMGWLRWPKEIHSSVWGRVGYVKAKYRWKYLSKRVASGLNQSWMSGGAVMVVCSTLHLLASVLLKEVNCLIFRLVQIQHNRNWMWSYYVVSLIFSYLSVSVILPHMSLVAVRFDYLCRDVLHNTNCTNSNPLTKIFICQRDTNYTA